MLLSALAGDILQTENNLSDLTSASTARANLGLGSSAARRIRADEFQNLSFCELVFADRNVLALCNSAEARAS